MPTSPNITDKEIVKNLKKLTEKINTGAQALKQGQETQYSSVVTSALESTKNSLNMVSEEIKQEIIASIAKFSIATPAPEATAPNPKASNWLAGAIERNQKKVDENANKHPLMEEPDTQPTMKRA